MGCGAAVWRGRVEPFMGDGENFSKLCLNLKPTLGGLSEVGGAVLSFLSSIDKERLINTTVWPSFKDISAAS